MSLHDDFGMYYNNTYIGVQQASGVVLPMWVDHVSNDSEKFNLRNYPQNRRRQMEHGEEAYNALVFNGNVYDGRNYHQRSISMDSNLLIFDLPDPKYIKIGSNFHWVSYRANRSTKKGMNERRWSSNTPLNATSAFQMFNNNQHDEVIGGIFLKRGNVLCYKGVCIGDLADTAVDLYPDAAHLQRVLEQEWPECQITVKAE